MGQGYVELITANTPSGSDTISNSVKINGAIHHMVSITTSAALTALTVTFQGSVDNENWDTNVSHALAAGPLAAKFDYFTVINIPYQYVRIVLPLASYTGPGTVTVRYSNPGI